MNPQSKLLNFFPSVYIPFTVRCDVKDISFTVRYYINITFPDWVIVENIIPRNVIINRGAAEVDNHVSREDIFVYHSISGNVIFILLYRTLDLLISTSLFQKENNAQPLIYMHE